jgi:hypothetical protein
MFHDIFHFASQNIAEPVYGVDFHIQVVAEPVKLGTVYIIFGVQVILRDILLAHRLPQSGVPDHNNLDFTFYFRVYGHQISDFHSMIATVALFTGISAGKYWQQLHMIICYCLRGHLLVRLCRTRSIGRPPDVENCTKTVLQASLTSVFVQFSPPREL